LCWTFCAGHALWNLIPAPAALGLLALVTAAAVMLSIRRDSLFIAVLGLLGGFATPALLSTGENRPIPLFAYLLLLNVGLAWVAAKKGWSALTVMTVIFTAIYQWGWVQRFLTTSQLSLAMGIFLVLALTGVVAVVFAEPPWANGANRVVDHSGLAAAVMPLAFAIYLAAVPAYAANTGLLFGFLLLIALALFALSVTRRDERPHAIGAVATMLTFAV